MVSRRRFLGYGVAASLARSFEATAQGAKVRRIGMLLPGKAGEKNRLAGFFQDLQALGHVEGETLHIERRYSEGREESLASLAAELVNAKVELILAAGPTAAAAAFSTTRTVPIIMGTHDPEAMPQLRRIAILVYPGMGGHAVRMKNVMEAVRSAQLQPFEVPLRDATGVASAFATMRNEGAEAFCVIADPTLDRLSEPIARNAAHQKLPGIYGWKLYAEAGGLMSYGASLPEMLRRWASFVDRILKGAKPGDLPMETPHRLELVLNQRAARELGFTFPPSLLIAANEVIS